jgi:2-dehydro-3-deoxyphosphogluconate aldolase / (4S)-4-hydroxy-2-oxoglutarate aldolase
VNGMIAEIAARRLLPVVVLHDAADAAPLADALVAGGLPVAEVTFRTQAAEQSLRTLSSRGDLLVGAGTVVTPDQVSRAADAGARFIVSPGFSAAVVRRCHDLGLSVIPGVATATELMAALDLGINVVKFFPAETSGGLAGVKALAAPFPNVRFVPTGGIGPDQLEAYLAHPSVLAVGGSWMVNPKLIAEQNFAEVTRLTKAAVEVAKGYVHAG